VASAIVAGAVLAYVSVRAPRRSSEHPTPAAIPAEKQLSSRTPAEDSADRVQPNTRPETTDTEVRHFLENWAEAARAGDVERASNMYAERLSTFFNKRNVSRAEVLR